MIHHYGLHSDGDLFFLHERKKSLCLTEGLSKLASPFEILNRTTWLRCVHDILPLDELAEPTTTDLPLLEKLAPIPDGGAYWVPHKAMPWIEETYRLCNPTRQVIHHPWATTNKALTFEVNHTNLAPLIIVNYQSQHFPALNMLLRTPRVRTIVFCGDLKPPAATTLPVPDHDPPPDTDWARLGTSLLLGYINKKVNDVRHSHAS
ncbi:MULTISPECIES: hypothetical protein [unclassified Beijerinckia]|uniref:hypothetical protein n=1 Tax=unclassified Beijerinckia TaxID=2638183 RepID=UPI00089B3CBE|nr:MULTISPECIES: hypothetical protein [unclassified Beijerinckia]MDH7796474.1 hypothetical protein [Beijerinckia sp. GAS462]SEC46688.1 hypothetical protein SAMN05443249_2758 [Beijerinckia sp. 28-YEA-48]